MLELLDKTTYFLSLYTAWHVLHKILFAERRKSAHPITDLLRILLLVSLHIIFNKFAFTFFLHPVLMLLAYYLLAMREYKAPWKPLLIESALTYTAVVVVSFLSLPLIAVFCYVWTSMLSEGPVHFFHIPYYIVTLVKCLLLTAACLLSWKRFRHKDLSVLMAKSPLRIFAVISTLFLTCHIFVRMCVMHFTAESNGTLLFAAFVFCISLALYIVQAMREHEVLTYRQQSEAEIEQKNRRLAETENVLGSYKLENHKLNKLLPTLEQRIDSLAETLLAKNDSKFQMDQADELTVHKKVIQAARKEAEAENARIHFEALNLDTGLTLINDELALQSKLMYEHGIRFDCIIYKKPDCARIGLSELELHQIVANLLSNAVHAVERQSSGTKSVIMVIGLDKGSYFFKFTDSGDDFPPAILENLGRLDNTTDGHGVGYVTLLMLLRKCGGSLFIKECASPEPGGLKKHVVIRFDGQGRVTVHSPGAPEALRNGRGVADLLDEAEYRP